MDLMHHVREITNDATLRKNELDIEKLFARLELIEKMVSTTPSGELQFTSGSASITLKKNGEILINGKDITINASGKVNIKGASDVVIKGQKILQN